jgi:hypothetical protein
MNTAPAPASPSMVNPGAPIKSAPVLKAAVDVPNSEFLPPTPGLISSVSMVLTTFCHPPCGAA